MLTGPPITPRHTHWAGRLRASRARFRQFTERKSAEACAATLEPLVTEFDTAGHTLTQVGNGWTRRLFDGPFYLSAASRPTRPSCSLVFVQSSEGNTGASTPMLLGGGRMDKHVIYEGLSLVAADAVLVGAGTVRSGDTVFSVWHPELVKLRLSIGQPRHPAQVVATRRGVDLDGGMLYNLPELSVIMLTVEAGALAMREGLASRPWIRLLVMDSPTELAAAFDTLRAWGVHRLSSVGGRRLARQLLGAGLVQDLYLTTSASPGGEPDTPLTLQPLAHTTLVRKHGTGADVGVVFEHQHLTPLVSARSLEEM